MKISAMTSNPRYQIINHGKHHEQYFQVCGVAFTPFDYCVTGIGFDAVEAYNDACEQVWCGETDSIPNELPTKPRGLGITQKNRVTSKDSEDVHWYVSIRYKRKG